MNSSASSLTSACVLCIIISLSGNGDLARAQSAPQIQGGKFINLSTFTNLHNNFNPYIPLFTPYVTKQPATEDSQFTDLLLSNAERYIPWLTNPNTQAHLGFWSGPGNRGNLVRLLGSINNAPPSGPPCTQGPSSDCAIWDEGAVESEQYPLYVEMLQEHWYERANAVSQLTVSIYGVSYPNINPLNFTQADQIWGQYSQRYADMAITLYHQTGKPVNAWCFLNGARPNRIFFKFEYPELRKLESQGYVKVYCTKNPDANWQNPNDWTAGTASANCLPPTQAPSPEVVTVFNRK